MTPTAEPFVFDRAGLRLAGERWTGDGDGAGATVVLLHGGGQTRHSWQRTAQALAASGRTAVALDARGHGDSAWDPGQDYSLDAFVGDLVAFVATLDVPPVLVGASLGGMTALTAAGEHPGLVHGLVLVDVVVQVEQQGVERIQSFMSAHPEGFASLDEAADAIAAYNPHRPRPRNLDGLRKNLRLGPDGRWRWHWDPAFLRIADEPQRHVDRRRLGGAAAAVSVPTLIIRGAHSDVVSDAGVADMLRRVPTARVAGVAGAGHMVAGDDNDVFAAALESFLADID
jgi:pimeloyl-ACP methyl ester carboxylesterase